MVSPLTWAEGFRWLLFFVLLSCRSSFYMGKKIGCTQVTSAKKLNKHISPASQLLFESDLISSSSFSGWVNWRAVGWSHVQPSCLQGSCYNFNGPLQNHWKKKNELKLSRTNIFFFKCLCLSLYISGYYLTFLCSCAFNHTYIHTCIHTFFLIGWVEDKNCYFPYDWGG